MRWLLVVLVFCFSATTWSQTDAIARQYLNDGDFEKAASYYEKLVKQQPRRPDYMQKLVECYQQLEKYKAIEDLLLPGIRSGTIYPSLVVDMGYTYQLQGNAEEAKRYYQNALKKIDIQPLYADAIGLQFQRLSLLDYAIAAYEKGAENNPKANYNFQLARIYGEKGDVEKMYDNYLQVLTFNKASLPNVQRYISQFITEDPNHSNNQLLKKQLLLKAQQQPDVLWNELLSWLFVQQHQYNSAFTQEKAIYRRAEATSLHAIINLGKLAVENKDYYTANNIYQFIIDNSYDVTTVLDAHLQQIEIILLQDNAKEKAKIPERYNKLLATYGRTPQSMNLQNSYARYLAFQQNKPQEAVSFLKESMDLPLTKFEAATFKTTLADILVFNKRFNEALIYYSQVQKSLKNHAIGQNARFKVAQTSFYKGDFDWAATQLKVLRASTSQLIANDAMQLSLLISDNSLQDSTQTALKKYAKADLLAYQNKNQEAINLLQEILDNHKGEKIEDEALFKQAQLLEQFNEYDRARLNYIKIIEFHAFDILADDALFALAELYNHTLNNPEKAKEYYEKIIFNHPDSIHFVTARKNYRRLRGDAIN